MSKPRNAFLFLLPWVLAGSLCAQDAVRFHRAKVGSLEVTALLDGELQLPTALLKDITPAEVERLVGGAGPVATPVNAFLVRMGPHLVLVDTGGSPAMDPALGNIQASLKAAGVKPEAIEAILITHCHGDHMGGLLTPDGKRAFPKAVVRLAKAEHDHWLAPAAEAALPEARRPMIAQLKATLAPYQAAGAYKPFVLGEAPFPGVMAYPAGGHTPGHTVYAFRGGAQSFWAVGDVAHFGKVQFDRPEATVSFDTDSPKAAVTRLHLWKRAAKEGVVLGAAHLAFPGLGHVETKAQAFAWVPLP